jgi:hypothetical protein
MHVPATKEPAMAAADRQHDALQTIFSFFLGLMVVAFIGVGANTFYPQPADQFQKELQPLSNEQQALYAKGSTPTPAEQARLAEIQTQVDAINARQQAEMEGWARNTSIVLVLLATLVMGISLIRAEQLRVVSNGLLLGGLFTMLYGAGWTIASGTSYLRFFVVLFALAVAIGLGYVKFVWLRRDAAAVPAAADAGAAAGTAIPVAVTGLEARVAALEAKTDAAAAAFGPREGA